MNLFLKILFAAGLLLTGCGIPKDPDESFKRSQTQTLEVGIVNNPPFTIVSGEKYSGIEVDMIREFATRNHLNVEFTEASESDLIQKLEARKIHILIGGFDKKTVWKEKAGSTLAYDEKHIMLVPKGENRLVYELESVIGKPSEL